MYKTTKISESNKMCALTQHHWT